MAKLYVRKQGNVCTIFTGFSNEPLPLASFTDEPGNPNTFHARELEARYPGWEYVFIEEPREPQPESAWGADKSQAELLAALGQGPSAPPATTTSPTPNSQAASIAPAKAAPAPAPLGASERLEELQREPFYSTLVDAFRQEALAYYSAGAEGDLAWLENLGSFLISAFPEIEEELAQAALPPQAARRRFKVGNQNF